MRIILRPVEFVPERPEPGVLYFSERFGTATHMCACGCGLEVVTPIKPGRWRLVVTPKGASLHPSIGNWSFPCRSHYWIVDGAVRWAGDMSPARVEGVRRRDAMDIEASLRDPVPEKNATTPAAPAEKPAFVELPTSLWLKLRRLF